MPTRGAQRLLGALFSVPMDLIPLYAPLGVAHAALAGFSAGTCVTTCTTLAIALDHLGFAAEPMAAVATVSSQQGGREVISDIGVPDRPPVVRPDLSTNGHMVLWAGSFARLVDPTIVQEPRLLAMARRDPTVAFPAIAPVPDRATLLSVRPAITRGGCVISWRLHPEWTPILQQILTTGPAAQAVAYAGLNVATRTLSVLADLNQHRDLGPLRAGKSRLAHLLTGRESLPPLPAHLPPEVARLLGM